MLHSSLAYINMGAIDVNRSVHMVCFTKLVIFNNSWYVKLLIVRSFLNVAYGALMSHYSQLLQDASTRNSCTKQINLEGN